MSMRDDICTQVSHFINPSQFSRRLHASYAGAFYVISGISANPAGFRNANTS